MSEMHEWERVPGSDFAGRLDAAPAEPIHEIIAEHQRMWHALDAIANGAPLDGDPGTFAASIRAAVKYRHAR